MERNKLEKVERAIVKLTSPSCDRCPATSSSYGGCMMGVERGSDRCIMTLRAFNRISKHIKEEGERNGK